VIGGREPNPTFIASHVDPQTKQRNAKTNPGRRPPFVRCPIVNSCIPAIVYVTSYT